MVESFLQFVIDASGDNETVLFVKQVPVLDEAGAVQYHGDGAIKSVWPSFIPNPRSRKLQEGAIYGNTGIFSLDRIDRAKPSASVANSDFVWCMVLDDIGTKSKDGKQLLPPTWIVQTSPGNYQHGYAFNRYPTSEKYAAAIKAMARCGYTDPGAINPVRNFRLPGSVNFKRDNFKSQLVSFDSSLLYNLDEILAAYGVTVTEHDAAGFQRHMVIKLTDDGNDAVLKWLSDAGHLRDGVSATGWVNVVCPNSAAHSDGNETAGYNPLHRSFHCLHGHCQDIGTSEFLAWVEAEGGPRAVQGPRTELIAETLAEALDTVAAGDDSIFNPQHDAHAVADRIRRQQEEEAHRRTLIDDMFQRYAYVTDNDAYFDLIHRTMLSRDTFNALYAQIGCRSLHANLAGGFPRITASKYFDERRDVMKAAVISNVTYAPGQGALVTFQGSVFGNQWINSRPAGTPGDATPWLNHMEVLFPDDNERESFIQWMAFKVQFPGIKINHQYIVGGGEGTGKDTAIAPFIYAVGGPEAMRRNVKVEDLARVVSRFTYHAETELLIINEGYTGSVKDRREVENQLKPYCAAPPVMLSVEKKGLAPYSVVNTSSVLMMSNHQDPIVLQKSDRRWVALWVDAPPMSEVAAVKLHTWYSTGGFDTVTHYLRHLDVSKFNPYARPAMTDAKLSMIEAGHSDAESYVIRMIERREGPFANGVVCGPFGDVAATCAIAAPPGMRISQTTVIIALKDAGWTDLGRHRARTDDGTRTNSVRVFCAPGLYSKSADSQALLAAAGAMRSNAYLKPAGTVKSFEDALKNTGKK